MPEDTPPNFLPISSWYQARDLGVPYRDVIGEGVRGIGDLLVTQRGAGANMSVDVSEGTCWIMGDADANEQPNYRCRNAGTTNVAVSAAHATLPRLDLVVAEVLDHGFDASGQNLWRLRVVAGTATSGATLDNRNGAAALPSTAILLADIIVAAADSSITNAEIRDRRPFAIPGVVPPLLTDVDMVSFQAAPGSPFYSASLITHSTNDLHQAAALMYLPRRIASATRIRWRYRQDGSAAMAGNYILGIYDASGRLIVATSSTAWTGATNSYQERSETITASTFEAGWYYVLIGNDSTAGQAVYLGVISALTSTAPGPNARNTVLRSATGGVSAPTTILSFTDVAGLTADTAIPAVPIVALSVG